MAVYPSGNRYEGDWQNGNITGYGILVYSDGDVYEGEWLDGRMHGQGRVTVLTTKS